MKSYLRHIPFLVVLAIVSLIMTREDGPKDRPAAGVWTELAPALSVPKADMQVDAEGGRAQLVDAKGKVVLLNLWATWCTPCLKELPTLKALDEQYRDKGLKVVTLSIDSLPYAQVEGFLKNKLNITLPILALDDTGEIYTHLNVKGLPVTYLISREGLITHRFVGATDWLGEDALKPIDAALTTQTQAR